jgi:hypothetical protein
VRAGIVNVTGKFFWVYINFLCFVRVCDIYANLNDDWNIFVQLHLLLDNHG